MATKITKTTTRRATAEKALSRALAHQFTNDGPQRELDSKGRLVRIDRASDAEVRLFLLGNRVVEQREIMSELGNEVFGMLVSGGYLRRAENFNRWSDNNLYWVTDRAQAKYKLPRKIELVCGAFVDYVPASVN